MHHTHFAVHTAEEPQSVLINSEGDSYRTLDIWPAVMALPPAQEITRLLTCFFFDPNFCDRELSKEHEIFGRVKELRRDFKQSNLTLEMTKTTVIKVMNRRLYYQRLPHDLDGPLVP
jgi:hypothetical protein